MEKSLVNDFAKSQGYKKATYICEWNGFKCYEPIMADEGVSYVGLPLLILEDSNGIIRMSTPEEAMRQIGEMR